ncbi:7-cyano-7-deazaguanine synthase [Deinococcus caeni]|uniref:7-cyano-7-deazaguanine synthase n=1 Tax=Deinococcus caeni TaxID=569127 RepID=UPI00360D2664
MSEGKKRAVVLLSGGLDSSTVLGMATRDGYACTALSFRYGQRHTVELERAATVAAHFGAVHRVIDINIGSFGGVP